MTSKSLFLLPILTLLFGCAEPLVTSQNTPQEEKVYITGSNLPQKKGSSNVGQMSKEEIEATKRSNGPLTIGR
jgi:hypothetical protein